MHAEAGRHVVQGTVSMAEVMQRMAREEVTEPSDSDTLILCDI